MVRGELVHGVSVSRAIMHSHISGERVQRLIEIIHLYEDANCCYDAKNVCARVRQLVVPAKCQFKGNPKTFDGHHRDRANHGAYRDINQRI